MRSASAADLARTVFCEAVARCGIDPARIDEVILGCAGQPFDAQNLARVAALRAGVPDCVPAVTVHRNCASGMEALTQALIRVRAGAGELFLVGGVEAMSRSPLVFRDRAAEFYSRLSRARGWGARIAAAARWRPEFLVPRVSLLDALTDPVSGLIMGRTAELLAREFAIAREAQDRFALESHRRAREARVAGKFREESMPWFDADSGTAIDADNGIRDALTLEQLAKLPPYFEREFGTVTIGNSCQLSDGAVALLVASPKRADELGIRPLGWLREYCYVGLDPAHMGLGPVDATARLLDRVGMQVGEIELVELNEAFAAQVLACAAAFESDDYARTRLGRSRALGTLDFGRMNVNGGAIALGHPAGATGARLVLGALHELRQRKGRRALATLCVGGGQGAALLLESE
jgi:acetyl-CoA C-acetyltransferase/acetyl-CoA acyltransferase